MHQQYSPVTQASSVRASLFSRAADADVAIQPKHLAAQPMATSDARTYRKKHTFDTCDCNTPPSSVMDAFGLHDVSATVVIIGGGPHALAALSALHENSLAFPQFGSDNAFANRVGFDSFKKIGSVCVVDPGEGFMQAWNSRFDSLDIRHLRSPTFAHPAAFEPQALLNFAIRERRAHELTQVVHMGKAQPLTTADESMQDPLMMSLPSSSLFRDFCGSLEAKLAHRWISGTAQKLCKDETTGGYAVHVQTADSRHVKVLASAVILSTGPVGTWNIPKPFESSVDSRLVLHTEDVPSKGGLTLGDEISRRCPVARVSGGARVLVVGGGISAAQAALAAVSAGHRVVLRSTRALRTRAYDIAEEWLDLRHANRLRFEFLSKPMHERRQAVKASVGGGSIPESYLKELLRVERESPEMLKLEVDPHFDERTVIIDDTVVHVNAQVFDMVILATGVASAPLLTPLYQHVRKGFGAPTVDGMPQLDSSLRWVQDEDIFVMGTNAMLELGPGAGNLMGAMRGARIISNELHGLMWKRKGTAPPMRSNQFDLLRAGLSDGGSTSSESDSETASDDDANDCDETHSSELSKVPLFVLDADTDSQ